MPFDFPNAPLVGDTVANGASVYRWDGAKWTVSAIGAAVPEAPIDGVTYGRKNAAWNAVLSLADGGTITGNVTFNGTVSGTAWTSPPAIGGTTPAAGNFTTLTATQGLTVGTNTSSFNNNILINGVSGTAQRIMSWMTGGVTRWHIGTDNVVETGVSNAGSNFEFYRYADDGSYLGPSLEINRSTGTVNIRFGQTFLGGNLSFGNVLAPGGVTDLSRHIALYSTSYGFNITSGRLNVVLPTTNQLVVNQNALDVFSVNGTNTTIGSAASATAPVLFLTSAAGVSRQIRWYSGTAQRWVMQATNTGESGSNVGSDFLLSRYADDGTTVNQSISITRSNGLIILMGQTRAGADQANYLTTTGAATTLTPSIQAQGSDANIGISITPKGTGTTNLMQTAWGSVFGASATDLGKHISLYSTTYGFGVTSTRLNYNVPSGAIHVQMVAGSDIWAVGIGGATLSTPSGASSLTIGAAAGNNRQLRFTTVNSLRWGLAGANGNAEGGSNAGSDFTLTRYADDGSTALGSPVIIFRQTGLIQLRGTTQLNPDLANFVQVTGGASGAAPSINATGSDANVGLSILAKGTGSVSVTTDAGFTVTAPSAAASITVTALAGQSRQIRFASNYSLRWAVVGANANAEGGGNGGSDFLLNRYADDGTTLLGTPITISRASGNITLNGNMGFNGSTPLAKPTVSGSRGGNAALASLITALANYGLVTDSTTA